MGPKTEHIMVIPLEDAILCVNCETVYNKQLTVVCPTCVSENTLSLRTILSSTNDTPQQTAVEFKSKQSSSRIPNDL